MAVLSRMFTIPHEPNWDIGIYLCDEIRHVVGVFAYSIVAGGKGVRVNFMRVDFFLDSEGSKSSCVELVTITAFLDMNVQTMSLKVETFTDGELVLFLESTSFLGQVHVVDQIGVKVLREHMVVLRYFPISVCLFALLLWKCLDSEPFCIMPHRDCFDWRHVTVLGLIDKAIDFRANGPRTGHFPVGSAGTGSEAVEGTT